MSINDWIYDNVILLIEKEKKETGGILEASWGLKLQNTHHYFCSLSICILVHRSYKKSIYILCWVYGWILNIRWLLFYNDIRWPNLQYKLCFIN